MNFNVLGFDSRKKATLNKALLLRNVGSKIGVSLHEQELSQQYHQNRRTETEDRQRTVVVYYFVLEST